MTESSQRTVEPTPGVAHDDQYTETDPTRQYGQATDQGQEIPHPGTTGQLRDRPDHGEDTYRGSGRLTGKKALITGGDSGIGRAVALAFAREGADVAIAYLPQEEDDAQQSARLIEDAGRRALTLPGDIRDEAHCQSLVRRTIEEFGTIDVLVNNAAYQMSQDGGLEDISTEQFDRTLRTNLYAMFWITKAALPHLRPGSSIVNTASVQAFKPAGHLIDYALTKGAIVNFTKSLGQDLLERGIRVNAVAPGPVWTPLIPATMDEEKVSSFGQQAPLGRAAQPAELAPAYVFLASQESSFVSAEVIAVTGGTPVT